MRFCSTPQNFTPIEQGLVFAFTTENDTPASVVAEIVDCSDESVVATLRLHDVTTAEVDIAPYIAPFVERKPLRGAVSMLCEAPTASYKLRIGEVESADVKVSLNRSEVIAPAVATTMSSQRRLACGESDEVLLFAEDGSSIEVVMESDTGESLHLEEVTSSGVMLFTIVATDFSQKCQWVDVVVLCDGNEVATLRYNIVAPTVRGVRLAWLSSEGSIERYTFPIAQSVTLNAERERVGRGEIVRTVACRSESRLEMVSRYEPRATIAALSEIVASSRGWLVAEEDIAVAVVTSTTTQNLFGVPSSVALTLRLWQREEALC